MKEKDKIYTMLTGYIDGELDDKQQREIEELLKRSPEIYQEFMSEKKIKEMLKTSGSRLKAPPYLRNRIRRAIANAHINPTFGELVLKLFEFRPLATSVAFAIIALLILLPAYKVISTSNGLPDVEPRLANSLVQTSVLDGEIICLDCELFSVVQKQYRGHDAVLHRPGLRTENGTIWTIIPKGIEDKMRYSRDLLMKKARLKGLIFANSRYIQVNKFSLL